MAPRSRTGCLTCRHRKLKCSEERPVCAQCSKARRECIPSSGITFRHQQNPSMNGDPVARESLKSFYGYKETFTRDSIWVPVPQHLTFVTTNNPYEDEDGQLDESGMDLSLVQDGGNYDVTQGQSDGDFARQLAQAAYPGAAYATHGLEALSAVASQDQYNYAPPPAPMSTHDTPSLQNTASPQENHATLQQSLDALLNTNHPAVQSPPPPNLDPRLGDHSSQQQQQQAPPEQPSSQAPLHVRTRSYTPTRQHSLYSVGTTGGSPSISDPELAFLMRDFSERSGAWMDLFDLSQTFATSIPIMAVTCPLLLYSCAALSAKSLSRVNGRKPVMNGQISPRSRSRMEFWPGSKLDAEGWAHKGRENYDLAVSLLRQALTGASEAPSSALPSAATAETVSIAQEFPLPSTDSDELLAATAILCVYEFLDASGTEWSRHLDGAKSLFDVAKDRMVPLTLPGSPVSLAQQIQARLSGQTTDPDPPSRKGPSKCRRAIFWNFARQDMLSAFINNTNTRLDTADLEMWRGAGLRLDPEGYLYPSNPNHPNHIPDNTMPDDTIANALIWLQMKLVNFIAAGDEMPSIIGLGVRQSDLLEYWHELDRQFQVWHEGLPDSFRAIAVRSDPTSSATQQERWFPRPMCASAMQNYHFARVLLLHNKPHESTGSGSLRRPSSSAGKVPGSSLALRHASYAAILQQSRFHAKEIVAISMGRADEGTRIHSLQALWTAGLVLGADHGGEVDEKGEARLGAETEMWRWTVLRLLRGIERDMGWATAYRVENLLGLWGWERYGVVENDVG